MPNLTKKKTILVLIYIEIANLSKIIETNTVIAGAGVIGLAIAARLCKTEKDIFVIEKNPSFGQETSSRNSEVIHAGIYYPENSLKARMCVKGRLLLYELCENKKIPFLKCGKIIVACSENDEEQLNIIKNKALANGVDNLSYLTKKEIKNYEPNVEARTALYSPSTGIIDSHRLMRFFFGFAKKRPGEFVFNTEIVRVEKLSGGNYKVFIIYSDGKKFSFLTKRFINCAGLEADKIAETVGIDIDACHYRQYFWKGEYFHLNTKPDFINRLVYPVPDPNNEGLGIHTTIDLSGRVRLGPNALYMPEREYDFTIEKRNRQIFCEAVKKYLPAVSFDDLSPDMAGIRPKLQKPGDKVADFVISEESYKGFPAMVNLVGIESPGLTSCMAIAEYVEKLLK